MDITANEIKIKGVSCIGAALKESPEAFIEVRGKRKYIVLPVEEYDNYREYQLEKALQEAEQDIEHKRYTTSIDEHLQGITA